MTEVAVGVLTEPGEAGWRVLIARRPKGGVLSGYWEFPGGKLEQNETLGECLTREFEEELALRVRVTRPLARIEHAYDHGVVRLHAFLCEHVSGEAKALEVTEFRWVEVAELPSYRFPPANDALLTVIADMLGGSGDVQKRAADPE